MLSALSSIHLKMATRMPSSIASGASAHRGKRMLQSEQAWMGQLYNGMVFNAREGAEDVVSAMQQMEPDELLQMEPLLRPRAVEDSPRPLMKFCPMCDRWRSVFEQTVCSLCNTPCEVTQDAMSKLPEGCNSGLMGM